MGFIVGKEPLLTIMSLQGANAILDKFKQISNSEQAVSGEGNTTEKSVLNKRRRSEDVEMVDKDQAEEMLKEINQQFQFPRLLSSRKLLELEVSMIICHANAYADSFIDRRYTIQTQCHCPVFDSIPIPVWIQGI